MAEAGRITVPVRVRDLSEADLAYCGWSGAPPHLEAVRAALERARSGDVEYLAVCPPSDLPVAIGGVDYAPDPDAGTLWQLAVHPALRSLGLGTRLVGAAEQRIRARNRGWARLSVEQDNHRARALYARLGYTPCGTRPESWDVQDADGSVRRYETVCTLMRKALDGAPAG
ncbi:GNAT family N-acetyltransferase [Streptomonospora sp. PA3]|uniref:GNAT family N-acetyltransferase n=1 Tax=Streptomonospora sp. PA3 TaxID=2607326 RepID=UPI001CA39E15